MARRRIVPEQGRPAGPRPAHWAPCLLKVHSFYAVRSTSSPPKSCRLRSDRGERRPETLPGAALLRPFYRLGGRRRPRSAWGRTSQGSGEAPPRRSWRRGAAAQRAPLPRPPLRLGGASGGAPARPVSLAGRHRRLQGRARPASARGAAAGGQGEGGAGAPPPPLLSPARGRKAARPGQPCAPCGRRAGPRHRRRCGSGSLPQWGWVSGGARRPGEGPGPAASLGDGVRQRGSRKMAGGGGGGGCRDSLFLEGACTAGRGRAARGLPFLLATGEGHGTDRGTEGGERASVCVHRGGGTGPLGGTTTMRGASVAWGKGGCRKGWLRLVKRDLLWGRA